MAKKSSGSSNGSSKPEKVFRIGVISASIFANEAGEGDNSRTIRSANLQRRYRDGDGDWKSSTSSALAELPAATEVLRLATQYIAEQEADVTPA